LVLCSVLSFPEFCGHEVLVVSEEEGKRKEREERRKGTGKKRRKKKYGKNFKLKNLREKNK
jgi:hypothetical protein